MRAALGWRVGTHPEESAYALAALCAAGREREAVAALLNVPKTVLDQAVLPLVRYLHGCGLTDCAQNLVRQRTQVYDSVRWTSFIERLTADGLDDYAAYARSLEPPPPPAAPSAEPAPRRGWFRGRSDER
jgi:hypothetical protein